MKSYASCVGTDVVSFSFMRFRRLRVTLPEMVLGFMMGVLPRLRLKRRIDLSASLTDLMKLFS
jgi:hypothetical protein